MDNSIPEEIRMKIESEAIRLYPFEDGMNKIDRDRFLDGAKFCYSVASKALSDAKAENHELSKQVLHYQQIGLKALDTNKKLSDALKENDRLGERCIFLAGQIDDRNRLIEQLKDNL